LFQTLSLVFFTLFGIAAVALTPNFQLASLTSGVRILFSLFGMLAWGVCHARRCLSTESLMAERLNVCAGFCYFCFALFCGFVLPVTPLPFV